MEVANISRFETKTQNFREAILNCEELKGLSQDIRPHSSNMCNSRFWSALFHKEKVVSSGGFGRGTEWSVIFLYDHETKEHLCVQENFSPVLRTQNICLFADYFEEKNLLVAQFSNRVMMYKINAETLTVESLVDSKESYKYLHGAFDKKIKQIIFDYDLSYLAVCDESGELALIKYDLGTKKIIVNYLPDCPIIHRSMIGFWVKELEGYPMAVVSFYNQKNSGYAILLQSVMPKDEFQLHCYKTEIFCTYRPNHFRLSTFAQSIQEESSRVQIDAYDDNIWLGKTVVPKIIL